MKWPAEYPILPTGWPADYTVIENRSDRVWVFGFVRLVPGLMVFGAIALAAILHSSKLFTEPAVLAGLVFVIFIAAVNLDRSTLLDPVDFVSLGPGVVAVKRLADRRVFPIDDRVRIELRHPFGEEYDERQRLRRYSELTIHLGRRKARLLVSDRDSKRIIAWATDRKVPLSTPPD